MRMPKIVGSHQYSRVNRFGGDVVPTAEVVAPGPAAEQPIPDEPTDPKAPRAPLQRDGDDDEPSAKVIDFLCFKSVASAQLIDAVSAMLSMVALILATWRLFARGITYYELPLEMSNTFLTANGTDVNTALAPALTVKLTEACTSGPSTGVLAAAVKNMFFGWWLPLVSYTPYELSITNATYDDVVYRGTTLSMKAGRWNPMIALVWIFIVSVFFQTMRVFLFRARGNIAKNNRGIWFLKLFSEYRPYAGPDFWRWIEYALTSPLQIAIIASTFNVRDRSLMLTLGTLQGALTLLGDSIEHRLRKLARHRRKLAGVGGGTATRKRRHGMKLVWMLISAWSIHGVIWYVCFCARRCCLCAATH